MGGSEFVWIGKAILLLQLIPGILGWGKDGHYTVCKIAQGYLSEDASVAVKELLPDSAQGDLASVCSWADEIRFHYHWSGPLHYIDTPDFRCNYNYSHNLTEALMFLSHFIGDIHQVWDNMIIESAVKMFYGSDLSMMIQAIQRNITDGWSNDILPWESCSLDQTACPDPYASESINLACKFAYRNAAPGSTLEDDYFLSRLPVVEKRLAQGGVRLAATLNRIFASQPSISQE
ncbi:hypothetical protein RHMOL_Rhmol13G0230000 [Rhododendron molle]|uniref:Uncharacterized protein n=1 Tax=Rhododendron molle TaxID=49168 RepID=A0ACC0LAQ1_RHOML|nr:hypothetical protein RHMOL_Rhmol13G0230000 [Rhododendron molle]